MGSCSVAAPAKPSACEKPCGSFRGWRSSRIRQRPKETGNPFHGGHEVPVRSLHKRIYAGADGLGAVTGVMAVTVDYGEARGGGYLVDKKQGWHPLRPGLLLRELGRGVPAGDISLNGVGVRWRKGDASGRTPARRLGRRRPVLPSEVSRRISSAWAALPSLVTIACERRIEVETPAPSGDRARDRSGRYGPRSSSAPTIVMTSPRRGRHFCWLLRTGARRSPVMPLAATIRNAQMRRRDAPNIQRPKWSIKGRPTILAPIAPLNLSPYTLHHRLTVLSCCAIRTTTTQGGIRRWPRQQCDARS